MNEVQKAADIVDVTARELTSTKAAPLPAPAVKAGVLAHPVSPEAMPMAQESGDTFTQHVTTQNSINVTIGGGQVGLNLSQHAEKTSVTGESERVGFQSAQGSIPIDPGALQDTEGEFVATPNSDALAHSVTTGLRRIEGLPKVTSRYDDDGFLMATGEPVGTPGTVQATWVINGKGKKSLIVLPEGNEPQMTVVQVIQTTNVKQKVRKHKTTASPYGAGHNKGLLPPDRDFLKKQLAYVTSRHLITDAFNPIRMGKTITEDMRRSMWQSVDASRQTIGSVQSILGSVRKVHTLDIKTETYSEYEQRLVNQGLSLDQIEEKRFAIIGTARLMLLICIVSTVIALYTGTRNGSMLTLTYTFMWIALVVTVTATSLFRAYEAKHKKLLPFSQWLKSPRNWIV